MLQKLIFTALICIPVTMQDTRHSMIADKKEDLSWLYHLPGTAMPAAFDQGRKKAPDTDTAALKQTNWYAAAMNGIAAREYNINYDTAGKNYTSPNRKNNLRACYTARTFTLQPRNESAGKWKLDLALQGIYAGKDNKYTAAANPVVTSDGNTIRFNNNNEFTTEYINNEEGVRQNFIIDKKPAGNAQQLTVKLNANKGWLVNKVNDKEIHFAKAKGAGYEKKVTYNGLKVWDANNRELTARFDVVKNELSINVNTDGAAYPVTIDPISTTVAAMVESNQAGADLGCSVSSAGDVNGDGYSDIIVGALLYDDGQTNEGAAFVYHGSATGISTTAAAMVESNQANAVMGYSVANAGDLNGDGYSDVIVGSPFYSNGQASEGAVFAYYGSAAGINTAAIIIESNQANAQLGFSVSSAGDVNGDGYSDVIIGAPFFDNGQTDEGAAFVFHGSASGINSTAAAMVESDQAGANIGHAVAGAGDINGDGYSDVVVGAPFFDNGQTDEGAVFIYHGSASGISVTAVAMLERNQANAQLGWSVAGAGDVNGDGFSDVIVGANKYDNGQADEGTAFIYHGNAAGIITAPAVMIEANQANALFGSSVACAGDINGDGFSDVIVGAYLYDNGQANEGAAFVYQGSATGINPVAAAMLESDQAGAEMGAAVAGAGDVNGDGYSDVIVGVFVYDNGQSDEGAAFVYHGSAGGISTIAARTVESNQSGAELGRSVSSAGDVNGDGYGDVIVGASFYDNGQADEGAAFIYHGSATGISATAATMLESNQAGAKMGNSVSCAGDVNGDGYSDVIVGANAYSNGQAGEGAAFVYHGSAVGISTTAAAMVESNQVSANLGISVAGAGDVNGDGYSDVIVGAYLYSNGQGSEGAAFLYHGSATGISTTAAAMVESNQAGALLGWSVAGAGDVNGDGYSDVIVGAFEYDNGQADEGAAFVYHGSATGINTTAAAMLESNQLNACLGFSVSSAGDVNGDGYSDVIVGALFYDSGQTDEGAAFVYHGSATGINTTAAAMVESNQANANLGIAVAGVGDVNGDGYSDVIVGADLYDNGQTDEGAAFVYHGSTTGINTAAAVMVESNQAGGLLGFSVAGAGDVNGDGYSDVIAGAYQYTNGQADEGAFFVYLGNNGGGLRNNLRLYNTDLTTPISHTNFNQPDLFGAGLYARSFLGRIKGKIVWEVKGEGQKFSGNPIGNSTAFLDGLTSFTDLGTAGKEIKSNVQKQNQENKVRVRVAYDKVTAITGQVYGPWRYPPAYTQGMHGMGSTPLPFNLLLFNGAFTNANDVQLQWMTANEVNLQKFVVQRSIDGVNFNAAGQLTAKGIGSSRAIYDLTDHNVQADLLYYRLQLTDKSGTVSYSNIIAVKRSRILKSSIAPNPVHRGSDATLVLSSATKQEVHICLYNTAGQLVFSTTKVLAAGKNAITFNTGAFAKGMYVVQVSGNGINEEHRLLLQ